MARRILQLYIGLVAYGTSMAIMVRSRLGLDPWDVFHSGAAARLGWSLGAVVIVVGAAALIGWIPLAQRPGFGTISNVVVIGLAVNVALHVVPRADLLALRVALVGFAITLNAVATAAYIGASLGPGPRDGLMTGIARRSGRSIRIVRTAIEMTVLLCGLALGGNAGIATVAYASAIGPLVQRFLPMFAIAAP